MRKHESELWTGERDSGEMPPVPLMQCPQCKEWMEDRDGFGVLAHEKCGYCSHPSITGEECDVCGAYKGQGRGE